MDETPRAGLVPDNLMPDNVDNNETLIDSSTHDAQESKRWLVVRQSHHLWQPPTDVFEFEDRLIVMIEIAGMRDGEFNVVLQDRRLLITGVRRRNFRDQVAYHRLEVRYGEFRAEVALPWPVARDGVTAVYRDGFLRVELPHARNQQIHIVDVDIEQEADI